MKNFIIDVESSDKFILSIENGQVLNPIISESTVLIEDSQKDGVNIILESSYISDFGSIVIEKFNDYNLEISNIDGIYIYHSGVVYMDDIVGDLQVSRIVGLDDYLDSYSFDCGTP